MARPRLEVPAHGTRQRYQHRSEPCRCGACGEANAKYIAGRRAARRLLEGIASWAQPGLYHDVPARMIGCTHSLQTIGERCSWCGHTATTVTAVPGVPASRAA